VARFQRARRALQVARTARRRRLLRVLREGAVARRRALEQLGTTYLKLGQLLSSRPDLLPEVDRPDPRSAPGRRDSRCSTSDCSAGSTTRRGRRSPRSRSRSHANRPEDAAALLLSLSLTTLDSDEPSFLHELRRKLPRYHWRPLEAIATGEALADLQRISLRYGVRLPASFALVGKTLSQADSIAHARSRARSSSASRSS